MKFSRWTTPPTFDDPEKTRVASLVYSVLMMSFTLTFIGSSMAAVVSFDRFKGGIVGYSIVVLQLVAIVVLRQGHVKLAARLLVGIMWGGIAVISALMGGMNASTVMMFTVIILIAGLMTGWYGNLIVTCASLALISMYFTLDLIGTPPPIFLGERLLNVYISSSLTIIATSLFLNIALQQLNQALATTQAREKELQATLAELQRTSYSKDYVDSIINSMLDMLIVLDENLHIVTINESIADRLNYDSAKLIGKPFSMLLESDDNLTAQVMALLDDEAQEFNTTTRYRTRYGDLLHVDFTASLLRSGVSGRRIVCVAHDVSMHVEAEAALSIERNLLRTLLDALPDYIHVKDLDGRYIVSNAAHMRYVGVESEDDLIGKTSEEAHGESIVTSYMEDTRMVVSSGQPILQIEREGINADGEHVWLQINKVPLLDRGQKMIGVVSIATDITQRKHDEERIRESEERLRAVVTSAPVFIFAINHDYKLTVFEGQGVDNVQIEQVGRVLGQSLFELADDETADLQIADAVKRAFKGESVKTTLTVPPLTFDIRYSPIYDLNGEINGVTGVATDISERVMMENALRESEARNRALLTAIPDMLFVIDGDGIVTEFTPQDDSLISSVDILGKNMTDLAYLLDDVTPIQEGLAACRQTGRPQTVETELSVTDQTLVYEGRLVRLNEDEVLAVVRDVTEARQAHEEIRRKDAMYRTLARNLPATAVMLFDLDLRYLVTEGEALIANGYDTQKMEGEHMQDVLSSDAVQLLEPLYRRTLTGETIVFEFPKQPSEVTYACTLLPLHNDDGDIYAGMLVVRDVTEDRRKSRELQQFAETLARSNAELQEFAYVASHDLQEPLRKIQAFGERLQKNLNGQLNETDDDYLTRMIRASERMQNLVQALLMLSRVTTQAKPFDATDLSAILQEVLEDLELRIEQTHAVIQMTPLPIIEAEPYQMRQLFLNLINNALKYNKPNSRPHIMIQSAPAQLNDDDAVVITFADNGIGFNNKYADRIFGVFQRLHGSRTYEGTGMGLAICRKIVKHHNGIITASGKENEGAVFTVTLPLQQHNTIGDIRV